MSGGSVEMRRWFWNRKGVGVRRMYGSGGLGISERSGLLVSGAWEGTGLQWWRGRYQNGRVVLGHGLRQIWVVKALAGRQTSIRIIIEQVGDTFDQFQRDGTVEKGMKALGLHLRIGQHHDTKASETEKRIPLEMRSRRPLPS